LRDEYFQALKHNVIVNIDDKKVVDNPKTIALQLISDTIGCAMDLPRVDEIGLDGRTLLFTLGISIVTGLLFGLAIAVFVTCAITAVLHRSQIDQSQTTDQDRPVAQRPPVHHPTRQLTRGPDDWPAQPDAQADRETQGLSGQFAGIDLVEFAFERQHARRMLLIWIAVVLSITGMVAAAAWTIGSNLSGLL